MDAVVRPLGGLREEERHTLLLAVCRTHCREREDLEDALDRWAAGGRPDGRDATPSGRDHD